MIRILVADDCKLIRESIKALLTKSQDLEIVGTADNGFETIEQINNLNPDLVLLDIEMPLANGIAICNHISYKFKNIKTIILSSHQEKGYIRQAIKAGAKGYLLKNSSLEELERSICLVAQGYSIFESQLLEKLIKRNPPSSSIAAKIEIDTPEKSVYSPASVSKVNSSPSSRSESSYLHLPQVQKNPGMYAAHTRKRDANCVRFENTRSKKRSINKRISHTTQKDILQIWIFGLAVVCVSLILLVTILIYS